MKQLVITKEDIVRQLAVIFDMPNDVVRDMVTEVFDYIRDQVCKGNTVSIRKFATISPRLHAARKARDIARKITIDMPARWTANFKASGYFNEQVEESLGGATTEELR